MSIRPSVREDVEAAIRAISEGQMVVVTDDPARENEADLIMSAASASEQKVAFLLRYGSGIICAPMTPQVADDLGLELMVEASTDTFQTAFTVTVDHRGCGTGISASDRTRTLLALADPAAGRLDFRRPGHVFPLISRAGGTLKRAGHTEAATDLVRLAGAGNVATITELMSPDGRPMAGDVVRAFARTHGLAMISIADLIRYRRQTDELVTCNGRSVIPTSRGDLLVYSYLSVLDGVEHVAVTFGDLGAADRSEGGTLVRVHSECLTGDLLGSQRCDCGRQLSDALDIITAEGAGVLVYLRGHEGRGIGLGMKLRAYELQDQGLDTVEANVELGLPVDTREYGIGAAILADLGIHRLRLITNNPAKYEGLDGFDLEVVGRRKLPTAVNPYNRGYLETKRDRMGHLLDLPPNEDLAPAWSP